MLELAGRFFAVVDVSAKGIAGGWNRLETAAKQIEPADQIISQETRELLLDLEPLPLLSKK